MRRFEQISIGPMGLDLESGGKGREKIRKEMKTQLGKRARIILHPIFPTKF